MKKDVTFEERVKKETKISEEMQHKMMVDEVKFMEKMKKDIDLDKIEMTAVSLVDESIEKAVSVADVIKQEIDVVLCESVSSEMKESTVICESKSTKETDISSKVASEVKAKEAVELVDLIDKTTEEIISYNGSKSEKHVTKAVEKFKTLKTKETSVESEGRSSTKKELEETIVSGNVRRKSEAFDKTAEVSVDELQSTEKKSFKVQRKDKATAEKLVDEKLVKRESIAQKASIVKTGSSSKQKTNAQKTDSKTTKQRAYTIGLQTIPNIKGNIHSSYHYNLLLKTFFIHLTDVMVALSRFILSEPVFKKEGAEEKTDISTSETIEYVQEDQLLENTSTNERDQDYNEVAKEKHDKIEKMKEDIIVAEIDVAAKQEVMATETSVKVNDMKVIEYGKTEDDKKYLEIEEATETKMLSGAKMAQLTERKSEELTQRMDAVITEFETKTGKEASTEVRERRSRSRSKIEEEVAKESDPLEWLSKVDKQTQEITANKTGTKCFSTSSESMENKITETVEKRESKAKSKEDKQMYVAIVESHVFTNKDAIFEEKLAELSETSSSIQSVNKVNVALQTSEAIATEKVAIESKEVKHQVAESVLEENRELTIINAQSEKVEMREVNAVIEDVKHETAIQQVMEPVDEVQEIKTANIIQDIPKVDIKAEEHTMVVSEKTEYIVEDASDIVQKEKKEQTVRIIEDTSMETALKSVKEEIIEVKVVEKEKPVEIVSTELAIVQPAKITPTKEEASAAIKIVNEQVLEVEQTLKLTEESEDTKIMETSNQFISSQKSAMDKSEHTEMRESETQFTVSQKSTTEAYEYKDVVQESSFTAQTSEQSKKLSLQLDLSGLRKSQSHTSVQSDPPSTIDTPTPATVPPTPLTDEYVFKLQIPLPKNVGTPIPRDCTPDSGSPIDEDPHIVKKKLIPHIDTTLDSPIIYDPPLPTPPEDKVQSPVYTKPGLRGGSDRNEFTRRVGKKKEEILEIERKSTLLASAIDETIKCIEEYKEEVGIETKKEISKIDTTKTIEDLTSSYEQEVHVESKPVIYNGYAKVETKIYDTVLNHDSKIEDEWNHIDEKLKDSNDELTEISCKINGDLNENKMEAKIESKEVEVKIPENSFVKESNLIIEPEKAIENFVNGDTIKENGVKLSFDIKIDSPPPIFKVEEKKDPLEGYRPIQFNPEELIAVKKNLQSVHLSAQAPMQGAISPSYVGPSGELLGSHQGIVDGLEEAVVDGELAKELGKPGMTEEKIAELISGESEMLREAHVMGLSKVLRSHMHRADDDSSVDFKKIKPIIESLKDSEVLKALNDELIKTQEEKKKEEQKKWTTFLQKPKRPVPRVKFGYYGYIEPEVKVEEPYKVKIVKQPKPKVAPDYKPEDFETGPLPWEERALKEPPPPPVDAEDPILVPEEVPEFYEAVDPLPESEVPDLEETGIPLPPPKSEEEEQPTPLPISEDTEEKEQPEELDIEAVVEETERIVEEMEQNRLAEQLLSGVQSMVDPNATVDQQLAQMRSQLAALAQLPNVIQQTLDLVTRQLSQLTQQESHQVSVSQTQSHMETVAETQESVEVTEIQTNGIEEKEECIEEQQNTEETVTNAPTIVEETKPSLTEEEREKLKKEEEEMLEEQRRVEKQKKEMMEQMRLEQESRQVKQRPTPRVGKPKPVFGPPEPYERPVVLPGGRKWRKPEDAYNETFIMETLTAQAELIQGKAMGSYESDILPYDERINFMKYEKPPVSLDHLQNSETYKLIHNMEQTPVKRVEMRTPVIAEADYREKCRSVTPAHMNMPQQVHP